MTARRPLISYFGIAFLFSWICWSLIFAGHFWYRAGIGFFLYALALYGPHLSAVATTAVTEGTAGVRRFYGRFALRNSLGWSAAAVVVPLLVYAGRDAIVLLFDLPHGAFVHTPSRPIPFMIITQMLVVLGEEPGWRGFALPRLADRYGPYWGTLILGLAWAAWHLPLFLLPGTAQYGTSLPLFAVSVVSWSFVMTFLVLRARGSIVPALLFHASANICEYTLWNPNSAMLEIMPWVAAGLIAALLIRPMRVEGRA